MNAATDPCVQVKAINDRHIPRVDKFFRMCAGASSRLLELGETTFLLEIKIDDRVAEESAPRLVWNVARSWRDQNPELRHCITCVVHLHRSPGPTGFLLSRNDSQSAADARKTREEICAKIEEIKRASELPAPVIGRYLLGFDPVEVMVRAPDRTPDPSEN